MPNIPKVKFEIASVNETVKMIHYFLNPPKNSFDWSHFVFNQYPELEKLLLNVLNGKERRKIELKFFKDFQKDNYNLIALELKKIIKDWEKINDKIMNTLAEIVEIDWPEKDREIRAYISTCPINPRYIKTREFDIYYKMRVKNEKEGIAIHEILHFIYFEKWKKIFPKTKEREFDSPYLVWQLSEMVPAIILNDKKIQKIIKHDFRSYQIYEEMKIDGKSLLSYLQKFYDERKDFADFLKNSWGFVNKYKKEINNITGL